MAKISKSRSTYPLEINDYVPKGAMPTAFLRLLTGSQQRLWTIRTF